MADPVSAIGGAVSIGGSLMQSDAADDAADAQQAAADAATAEQKRQFDILQKNQAPFLNTGTAANQRLAYLLGLNPSGGGATGTYNSNSYNPDDVAKNLGITKQGSTGLRIMNTYNPGKNGDSTMGILSDGSTVRIGEGGKIGDTWGGQSSNQSYSSADQARIDAEIARQRAAADAAAGNASNDPAYGSLTKSFGMSDYTADPGYAFRLSEGQKALDRAAASKGGFNSGAAAKALIDYNQNMGSQEYGAAYDRYNTNQTNLYNRLAGVSGTGQTAANTLGQAGQNYANQVSSNLFGAANAQGAGSIAQANAWGTGLNNIAKSFGGNSSSGYNPAASGFYNSGTFNSGAAASGLPWSDIRLKEDIKFIGVENGHNMWEFRYIGKPQKYIGVMSYEVMKTNPDAVHLADNGFYCVDYSKLGVEFREVA